MKYYWVMPTADPVTVVLHVLLACRLYNEKIVVPMAVTIMQLFM